MDHPHRGSLGRDLPERYGPWQTVSSRFYRWRKAGLWDRLFAAVQQQADGAGQIDWEVHFVDSTIVRAHQHAAGAKKDYPCDFPVATGLTLGTIRPDLQVHTMNAVPLEPLEEARII